MPRREISQHDNVLPVQNETSVHEKPADDPLNELSGQIDYLDFRGLETISLVISNAN